MSDPVTLAIAAAAAGKATEAIFGISKSTFKKLQEIARTKLAKNSEDEQVLTKAEAESNGDTELKALAAKLATLRAGDSEFDQLLESLVPASTTINWNDYRVTNSSSSTITNNGTINAKNVIQTSGNIENLRLDLGEFGTGKCSANSLRCNLSTGFPQATFLF